MSSLNLDTHTFTDLMKASSEAMGHLATEPQKQSGNYRKGRTRIQGLDVVIEQPRYTYRTGTDKKTGVRWSCVLEADYGYFAGTSGADDEAIDCFVGVFPESNAVYVINQQNESGGFDEHKVMLGFLDYEDAKNAYQDSYTHGWGGFADMIPCTMVQFKWWLKFGDHKKPITRDSLPFDTESEDINMEDLNFNWAEGEKPTAARVLYKLGETDTGEELLEPVTMGAIMDDVLGEEGGEEVEENEVNSEDSAVMDALVIKNAQLERKANIIGMALNRASNNIKVAENGVQISKPYTLQGVTQRVMIFEMTDGQTISAFLHNPDVKPKQISADDNLIAWKWLLNRKDITIVVAKESGKDLRIPVVAARVMALVNKNSTRFLAANEKKAERTANIANLEKALEEKRNTLQEIVNEIEAVKKGKSISVQDNEINEMDIDALKNYISTSGNYQNIINAPNINSRVLDDLNAIFVGMGMRIENTLKRLGWSSDTPHELKKEGFLNIVLNTEKRDKKIIGLSVAVGNEVIQFDPSVHPDEFAEMIDAKATPVQPEQDDSHSSEETGQEELKSIEEIEGNPDSNPEGKTLDLEVDPEGKNTDSQPDSEGGAENNLNTANFLQAIIDNGDISSFGFDVSNLDDEKLLDVLGELDSQIPIAHSEERELLEKASQVVIDQTLNSAKSVV